MTYLYYKSSYTTNTTKPNEKTMNQWKHLATKKNWRITQLPNGFYQTECSNPENEEWHAVTRRETIEGAETAINGSIDHFSKKIEATQGPKVIKTLKNGDFEVVSTSYDIPVKYVSSTKLQSGVGNSRGRNNSKRHSKKYSIY